ncbi:MAG: LLM class flavin-dependent oxidoreductase [Actinomycetales bacterium]|nr:LLM class flavin-dependent oxidoreductase [Actinomycetales bacterium]
MSQPLFQSSVPAIPADQLQFGLDTFGDNAKNDDGTECSSAQTIRNVVAQAVLADQVGLNSINLGEHHRPDFAISAPDTILAGIATVTKNITLGTGVTVLSSEDPVRVYQRFATLDALSNGRAEITAGRGSFIESFPLFGYSLQDYEVLFEEKLDLLVQLWKEQPVTWSGTTRASLNNQEVYPKTERGQAGGRMGIRVGVGGSPESVVRAAKHGVPMALAIIGGDPARFTPFAKLYFDYLEKLEQPKLPVSIHSPGHVAATDEEAIEQIWPHYQEMYGRLGRERGWGPTSKEHYLQEVNHGSMYVGSPETVAQKIAYAIRSVGATRFDLKYATGPMPHSQLMSSIELYGTQVVPRVRELLS